MKRVLLVLLALSISFNAYAVISTNEAENNLISIVRGIKNVSINSAQRLATLKQEGADWVTEFSSSLDATDKTNLTDLGTKVATAIAAIDVVISDIENDFSVIK